MPLTYPVFLIAFKYSSRRITGKIESLRKWREEIAHMQTHQKATKVQMSFYESIRQIMLDDHPELYKNE
jgi:hypothetical protein